MHWHSAAQDSWFRHPSQEIPGEDEKTEWCEPVDVQIKKEPFAKGSFFIC